MKLTPNKTIEVNKEVLERMESISILNIETDSIENILNYISKLEKRVAALEKKIISSL